MSAREAPIFVEVRRNSPRQRPWLGASLALHALVLTWIVFPRTPAYIKPSLILSGENGRSTIYVYLQKASTDMKTTLPQEPIEDKVRLTWQNTRKKKEEKKQDKKTLSRTPQETEASAAIPANEPLAGSRYGSLSYGATAGSEVRPAIRVKGSEPQVYPWDWANIPEGNIVIEVTIDERGNIIQKTVLQSMGPTIDHKVMAALEDWHFLPAMRDGEAIASKQDVYYHFPVRR